MRKHKGAPDLSELSKLSGLLEDSIIPDTAVRKLFGGICRRTIKRWEDDKGLGFPAPIVIRRRKHRLVREIIQFIRRQYSLPHERRPRSAGAM